MSSRSATLPSDELAYTSASELAGRIRRRDLSPVEVVDAFVQRIEARNPSLNAFVYLDFAGARKKAKEAESALMAGEQLGLLHGVPSAPRTCLTSGRGGPQA
jgi:amidase